MSNQGPNLWWVFDSEDKSFSTLPTGPFMLPVLIIIGIFALFRSSKPLQNQPEAIAGALAKTEYWQEKKKRYYELIRKSVDHGLDYQEGFEFRKLEKYMRDPWGTR